MYTDPDGESILAAIAIGAFIGGGLNYGIKKYNGQINSVGDAFAAFGWGALGGAAGTYAAVTLGPVLAGYGFMGGFAMGMTSSFANSVVLSFGNNRSFGDPVMGPNEMIFNSMLGGLMCGVGNGILSKIAGRNFWNGRYVKTPTPDTELLPQKPLAEPAKELNNSPRTTQSDCKVSSQGPTNNPIDKTYEFRYNELKAQYEKHLLSKNHTNDALLDALQCSKEEGFQRMYETVKYYNESGMLKIGDNQIRIIENGFYLEIRCNMSPDGVIRSFNGFVQTGTSPRNMGGNIINVDW